MVGDQPSIAPPKKPKTFASFFQKLSAPEAVQSSLIKQVKFINGTPTLEYEDDEFEKLIAPHRLSLVGKFLYGCPKMEEIHKEFKKIGFNGDYTLGLMNPRHILIRIEEEDDYQRCWIRTFWNIAGFSMRILKWTLGFRFEEDPPVVPIWVSLYDWQVEFMHPEVIFSMASAIGQSLKVDTLTLNMTRPSVARFCVEVDLMKDLPKSVRIGKKGRKHEQIFTYEHVPSYCSKCSKIGHKSVDCKVGKPLPQLKEIEKENVPNTKKKGVKLQQPKVTRGSKHKKDIPELDVEILKRQSLTVRAIAKPANESQWQTLAALPETRAGESTSGLSEKEKSEVPVDVSDSPTLVPRDHVVEAAIQQGKDSNQGEDVHLLQSVAQVNVSGNTTSSSPPMAEEAPILETSNRYAALEEVSIEVVDEEVVKVADVFEEDAMLSHEIQNISELVEAPRDEPLLATTSPLDVGTCLNDGVWGMSADDDDRANIDRGSWSDGNAETDHVLEPVQGEGSIHKKHGRKSKKEKVQLLDGFMPRQSSRAQ
ncbi:OLC1v1016241C1 [Oldenlandia corymbosa var. corymbosa]|uniref:OLC1v1016241C1 n=1 Tax=Oldenlandia corymbosa var. corymbosa TaxID=529605 RepID=A0AAV1E5Y9_OLDCO|nr:OLC1v1016241C1 [Oldenlandia corymbosa var. corymbosa]